MKPAKRQIILGALILALGAAVYLNWQFTDTVANGTIETSAQTSDEDKIDDSNLGVAQLVNSNYIETVTDEMPETDVVDTAIQEKKDNISSARIERQSARDEALEILNDILDDGDADSETKKTAVDESAVIAQNMIKESTAENLIKAKGVSDVVVFINDDKCSIVATDAEENMLIIQEIIVNQTGFTLENIQVLDA